MGPMIHLALDDLMKPARPQPPTELKLATLEKHTGAMTGPVQKKVQLLKLLHRTEGRARAALRQTGDTRRRAFRSSCASANSAHHGQRSSAATRPSRTSEMKTKQACLHTETHRSSATFMMIDNTDNMNDAQSIRSYAPNTDCLCK